MPVHLLLTDLVEAHEGSSELIRLLNSVDAIASADTHQRYIQFQIERKHRSGILSELNMTNISVASITSQLLYYTDQVEQERYRSQRIEEKAEREHDTGDEQETEGEQETGDEQETEGEQDTGYEQETEGEQDTGYEQESRRKRRKRMVGG